MTLWGDDEFASLDIVPCYDEAVAAASEDLGDDQQQIDNEILLNGITKPKRDLEEFSSLTTVEAYGTLAELPTVYTNCPFCNAGMHSFEELHEDPYNPDDVPNLTARHRLDYCQNCRHWRLHEARSECIIIRNDGWYQHALTVLSSKTRTFDERAPEGTLQEISQFFRRHPNLYHSVSPVYLEKLTARVFKEFGNHTEVRHVGRPADGGVDVLLIEDEEHSWLVQVKRRENPTKGESVETIRNLLGTMILEGKTLGAVVSTADHFTLPARKAVRNASEKGFVIELVDQKSLDAMLSRALPAEPWRDVLSKIEEERSKWFDEKWR
ncbi:restriction endonuclease [Streptomyces qinglanensis]|uniref:Restriction endonuclease n=1 Tax=Streptomyces qinglanensis TaxID=943816 RepID=A0A1H9PHS6_9ACTN|nr:restriction endonuclease [Streptomyces qinglanensis]SER47425.1 Restriction endonuclease [Streptomyces qinglanensis]